MCDGAGMDFDCTVEAVEKEAVTCRVVSCHAADTEPKQSITLFMACLLYTSQTTLYNTEVIMPDITEAFVAALRGNQVACKTLPRDHDDFICAPDGKHAHFIAPTIDISDEIECGPHLDEDLIEAEDDSGAFKLLLETEEDVVTLEESRYMISRPLCLCAESADLLEQGLRVFPGLALYDGCLLYTSRCV